VLSVSKKWPVNQEMEMTGKEGFFPYRHADNGRGRPPAAPAVE
jgi:hypothetical protein